MSDERELSPAESSDAITAAFQRVMQAKAATMTRAEIRARQAYLRTENTKHGALPVRVPRDQWPVDVVRGGPPVESVWRSNRFLVTVYVEHGGMRRLSICRTFMGDDGRMLDGITWEELQTLKAECGFSDREAVEVFPADRDVVNVANMRHLWVMPTGEGFPFTWKADA